MSTVANSQSSQPPADYYQLAANVTTMEAQLSQWNATVANLKASGTANADDIAKAEDMLRTLGQQLLIMSRDLSNLQAGHPKLTPPSSTGADTSLLVGGNPWMAPSSIVAFITLMQKILKESARYAFIEKQNEVTGMGQTLELGKQQAELERQQGQTEANKAFFQAGVEAASAAVQIGGVGHRAYATRSNKKQSPEVKAAREKELSDNSADLGRVSAKIAQQKPIAEDNSVDGGARVGGNAAEVHARPSAAQKAAAQQKLDAARDEERGLLKQRNEIEARHARDDQETQRQTLVTLEQGYRGVDHVFSSANKVVDGVYAPILKDLEAKVTMTRTYMDILKTYTQSATKGADEARDWAKSAADAMNQAFSQRTQNWRGPN